MNHELGGRPFFAPEVVAQVNALAGELPAETDIPLSLFRFNRPTGSTKMPSAPGNTAVGFPQDPQLEDFSDQNRHHSGTGPHSPEPGKWKFTRVAPRKLAVTLKRTCAYARGLTLRMCHRYESDYFGSRVLLLQLQNSLTSPPTAFAVEKKPS